MLTGHSLGAATAALLKMLICSTKVGFIFTTTCLKIDASKVFCYGYGSAPCVDRNLADSFKSSPNIINVVLQVRPFPDKLHLYLLVKIVTKSHYKTSEILIL